MHLSKASLSDIMIVTGRVHRSSKCVWLLALISASLTMCGITVIANDIKPGSNNVKTDESQKHGWNAENTILPPEPGDDSTANCEELYILVSTIDGKMTALDLHNHGSLMWAVEADSRPLYSSSLANMEIIRKGKKLRVIPSLDGALYQYDGEKVEAVPMSAETLLSNTYRLSDDAMVVGSKEIRNYGVDLKTGEIRYTCGSEGCKSTKGQVDDSLWNKVLVLTRTTQVVRSVDIKNGIEKWNFSVGQHQVNIPATKEERHKQIDADDSDDDSGEYVTSEGEEEWPWMTKLKREKCSAKFPEDLDIEDYLRLIVPEGKVIALNKEDTSGGIRWEHKFESPIAKAWLMRHGKVEPMNLFDGRHLPTLGTAFEPDDLENESMHQPLLYIGSHQKHLYIQPSPKMEALLKNFPSQRVGHVFDANLKVSWRPYLNTASVRTPIFGGNRPAIAKEPEPEKTDMPSNALTVWHEDYPFDTGYFLYPDFVDGRSHVKKWPSFGQSGRPRLDSMEGSLWSTPKVILGGAVLVVVGLFSIYFTFFQSASSPVVEMDSNSAENVTSTPTSDSKPVVEEVAETKEVYVSRFTTDFECLQCLGKGGFGIVFEAVHRFDNNHYAVKRTMLPDREGAREKVLREAKCLAKLEHRGITRYFGAWVESPPLGWQEEEDKKYLANDPSGITFSEVQSTTTNVDETDTKHKQLFNKSQTPPDQGKEACLDTDSGLLEADDLIDNFRRVSSGEFSVHSSISLTGLSDSYKGYPSFDGLESSTTGGGTVQNSSSSDSLTSEATNSPPIIPLLGARSQSTKKSHSFINQDLTDDSVVFEESSNTAASFTGDNILTEDSSVTDDSVIFEEPPAEGNQKLDDNWLVSYSSYGHHTCGSLTHTNDTGRGDEIHSRNCTRDHTTIDISASCCEEESKRQRVSETKHFLYIQMQLYRKDTLKDWLYSTSKRDHTTIVNIFMQLVEAVDYLHTQRLMHRDLKPSNIFFSDEGVVKVGDFGLVTSLAVEQDEGNQNLSNPGRHTAEVGTTLYMSPEQISKQPYDFKVDIFSLGLILLELCIPFSTQMERIRSLLDVKRQIFPPAFVADFTDEYDLVTQMTSIDASHRPTAHDILDHKLLKDFEETGVGHRRSRSRTISSNGDVHDFLKDFEQVGAEHRRSRSRTFSSNSIS